MRVSRLSLSQQAALIRCWNAPSYEVPIGNIMASVAKALIRKGYLETVAYPKRMCYGLTYAGIRFNQTGKQIGE